MAEGEAKFPPFWQQYRRLKDQHPDALLWTRVGDFYELFEEDARIAARELHITLTSKELGKGLRVPLAGVPCHHAESYLARLIRKGFHVAICEQMSEPGHGLVDREVVRVVTPGTVAEPGLLPPRANNFLAAVLWQGDSGALAYVDVSTGEFAAAEFVGAAATSDLEDELRRLAPVECLVPQEQEEPCPLPGHRTTVDPWHFDAASARERLQQHFQARSLAAFGCEGKPLATACAGAILRYVSRTNASLLSALTNLTAYGPRRAMVLDGQTRQHLDLLRASHGTADGSLLATVDRTRTAMGARQLRRWLGQPLLDVEAIHARQAAVRALVEHSALRTEVRRLLTGVLDVERILARLRSGAATAREVWGVRQSLLAAHELARLRSVAPAALGERLGELAGCEDVAATIAMALAEPGDGAQTIAPGYHDGLDALRQAAAADREWIAAHEAHERGRTGIRSLKLAFNKVFGYYIEVTNPNRALVPPDYVRKQTVAGAERYVTPQLKEVEARLLRSDEETEALERVVFADLLRRLAERGDGIARIAAELADLDVLASLAEVAAQERWSCPRVDESTALELRDARHPVVEGVVGPSSFIPNDCHLTEDGPRTLLLTGPNMAGKSTYLRQVALLAVLAQIGSFVPAASAHIGVVDRIFTRVGAHDDLAGGASTFMVEMMETATICRQATKHSLIVLDEVGRGTSTDDGRAIAQAVLRYLHDTVQARTLFATHFRDLALSMAGFPRLECWTFAVLELSGQVAFTHRLTPGVADRSYGLHVAAMAGMPEAVLAMAKALMDKDRDGAVVAADMAPAPAAAAPPLPVGGDDPDSGGGSGHSARAVASAWAARMPVSDTAGRPGEGADGPMRWPPSALATLRTSAPGGAPAWGEGAEPDAEAWLSSAATAVLRELAQVDIAHTTPLQALLTLAELQRAAAGLRSA